MLSAMDQVPYGRICVKQNLLRRGKSIKVVTPATGYSNGKAFARAFMRRTGVSPNLGGVARPPGD